jgi:hypothetical protein
MQREICELCRYQGELGTIKKYYVIPQEITEKAGLKRIKIIKLCPNCQSELSKWYSTNISDITYDTRTQRFRAKSPKEMVKEYEVAYQAFTRYKKEQQKIV